MRRLLATVVLLSAGLFAQRDLAGIAEIRKSLDRLNTLGSVLMIAAHPDDENTGLIAYFARGRNMRTGYLSLTRGEGGQNLIGPEQGDKIGIIRTQELLSARRIDGGEQMFGRMVDFGFSKTAEETIGKWGREQVLADMVWNIRRFRPDIIVLRFSGTSRDGHGHHQTSALLSKDAFAAAADPTRFPEQLKLVEPWQAKRLYFNLFNFTPGMDAENDKRADVIAFDAGEFDPVLGYSYTEIAGMSRSQHRSQAMGAPERKGVSRNHLLLLAGDKAAKDAFEDIDTTWKRLGLPKTGELLDKARRELKDTDPSAIVPTLLEARALIATKNDELSKRKLRELDETIALCAGLWVDISAERSEIVPGSTVKVSTNAIVRSKLPVTVNGKVLEPNRMTSLVEDWTIPADRAVSEPYWLREPKDGTLYRIPELSLLGRPENPPELRSIKATVAGTEIVLDRPVHHRFVDRVEGELVHPLVVVPAVAVALTQQVQLFPSKSSKSVEVMVTGKVAKASGTVSLEASTGWTVEPASQTFTLSDAGEQTTLRFTVTPTANAKRGELKAIATMNGRRYDRGIDVIRYPHFPPQTLFPLAVAELVPLDVKNLSKRIGYIMGAGDEVPNSLRELSCTVTMLSAEDLAHADLTQFDAIVTGIRAYNTRPELRANHQRLMDYVAGGGTMVVQYNVVDRFSGGNQSLNQRLGPYPMQVGNGRITDENAKVELLDPANPVFKYPNVLTAADWDGWIQERGLYFPSQWDAKYQPLFRMSDPGEKPQDGSTLLARHGKGVWIYTSLAFFRELPAGVPGAYRIFANLLSAAKAPAHD